MGAGRNRNYNPRTGTWTRPKAWYDTGRKSSRGRKKSGCYVATAIYGSYDCPEVWILRRYRDNYLSNSLLGKVFIKSYYAISPAIVKLFGSTNWFNKIFRNLLDQKIAKLKSEGYSSERYVDPEY